MHAGTAYVCERRPEPATVRGRKVVPSEFGEVHGTFTTRDLESCTCVCMVLLDEEHATLYKMMRLPDAVLGEVVRTVKRAARLYEVVAVDLRDERGERVGGSDFMDVKVGHGFFTAYVTVTHLHAPSKQ
jgi:hypothetical protein